MRIQKQEWYDFDRHLIIHEYGSVMLEIYEHVTHDGTTAYIGSLWVDEEHRRKGVASTLMDKAEEIAKEDGHECVTLFWDRESTPREIYEWYKRRGYEFYRRVQEKFYMRKKL